MTAPNGAPAPPGDTHFGDTPFGFRTVGIDHKQAMVDEVFDKVAPRYDLMNDEARKRHSSTSVRR